MEIRAEIWDEDRLKRLEAKKTHAAADKEPVYALYLFASVARPIVRAGAIGVNRAFDPGTGAFPEKGNSVSRRFDQYNRAPAARTFRSGANKAMRSPNVLPWSARPYRYIWGATLTGGVTPQILSVAENIMHQRLRMSGLRYRGSSCLECDKYPVAVEVAARSLAVFLRLAPIMFAAPED
ncbi:MAG: hypothetical protein ICV73_09110 [Acetobacteraceae bacterium]|nr:hypothetical protein [Acetobacteraceae bacterium]